MDAIGIPRGSVFLALATALVLAMPPQPSVRHAGVSVDGPGVPAPARFVDEANGLEITPPAGWHVAPDSSLNPSTDPPEPVLEVARFQLRLGDAALYDAPVSITGGLVEDAGAVISIGIAREGSDLASAERTIRGFGAPATKAGFLVFEDESTYEGMHNLVRYLLSRTSPRVLVVRAVAADIAWTGYADAIRAAVGSFAGDPGGANAPPPPPPPAAAPAEATIASVDPTIPVRNEILSRASRLLGLRYVWGGNSTSAGMDCSAYVSWTWGVGRFTTDSIWQVSHFITKEQLRPGDAVNLTIARDPRRTGHIRLFEAWANDAHTLMWVYEETPPRAIHRVVAYDDRYQPIRLNGLSGAGEVRVIPGTPAPTPRSTPAPQTTRRPRPTVTPAPTPTRTRPPWYFTPRPATAAPSPTPPSAPTARPSGTPTPPPTTPRPTPTPTRTP